MLTKTAFVKNNTKRDKTCLCLILPELRFQLDSSSVRFRSGFLLLSSIKQKTVNCFYRSNIYKILFGLWKKADYRKKGHKLPFFEKAFFINNPYAFSNSLTESSEKIAQQLGM